MSDVKRRYFVLKTENTAEILAMVDKTKNEYLAKRKAFMAKHGVKEVLMSDHSRIIELLVAPDAPAPLGTKNNGTYRMQDGRAMVRYKPMLNRKSGIELYNDMAAVGGHSEGALILKRYDCARHVYGGGRTMWCSTAGIVKNQIVIQVPEDAEQPFTPPESFKELKKSEWIALTEE